MITRRIFLAASASLPLLARWQDAWAQDAKGVQGASGGQEAGVAIPHLRAMPVQARLVPDAEPTGLWSFNTWPSPVLRGVQGKTFAAQFSNSLDSTLRLGFFGVRGAIENTIFEVPRGGEPVEIQFTPPDAGTFWLAPLRDVSLSRAMGLHTLFIVDEAEPLAPNTERFLVIDDFQLTDSGAMNMATFGSLEAAIAEGRLGNWFTVNGASRPKLDAPANLPVRLRVANVSNARTMVVLFKGTDPAVLAFDGQPISPRPVKPEGMRLAPGQRADLLLPPGRDTVTFALDLFEDVVEIALMTRSGAMPVAGPLPLVLPPNPVPELGDISAARAFTLRIEGGAKGGLKSARLSGQEVEVRALLERGYVWAINGQAGYSPDDQPLMDIEAGSLVILTLDNQTAFEQALFLHGAVWAMLDGDVQGDWVNSAIVPARTFMKLTFVATEPGLWPVHSLVAERQDSGLIGWIKISAPPGVIP